MHEILTLQLGHRANHVATHFWNAQESYFTYDDAQASSPIDHDIHFRAGVGAQGEETFTPRTLIYDLKGGFGGLRKWGGVYDQQQLDDGQTDRKAQGVWYSLPSEQISRGGKAYADEGLWDGNVVLHTDPQISQSEYQRSLDEGGPNPGKLSTQTVRYWSDFNRVFYHPRSIVQINDYELGSSLMPFEKWESGEELFIGMNRESDLLDRDVRVWAEECDQMQAIQIYTGGDDAWGGFAAKYVESLRDEFGKMAIWVWGIEDEQGKGQRAKQLLRAVNTARTINESSRQSSMYIPLTIPGEPLPQYVQLDRGSEWHTSALLSTGLETMTLPSRSRSKAGLFGDLEAALNTNGNQQIAELQYSMMDLKTESPQPHSSQEHRDDRAHSGSSLLVMEDEQVEVVNETLDMNLSGGAGRTQSFNSQHRRQHHVFGAIEVIRGVDESLDNRGMTNDDGISSAKRRKRFANAPVFERYRSSAGFPLPDSFPNIFQLGGEANKIAVHSSLSTTSGISARIKTLQGHAGRLTNLDERESLINGLGEISEAYEEGWQSGSEDDSDD